MEVSGENIEGLTLSLDSSGVSFEGRVTVAGTGSPKLENLHVALIPLVDDGKWAGGGQVKKDGTFELTSIMNGSYGIRVWGLDREWYVKSALGPDDILEKGLQVDKGSSGGKLEIVVSPASAQLEGSVTEGDQSMIGAYVRITPDKETPYSRIRSSSTRTDQTGHFVITGLAPGKYRVVARSPAVAGNDPLKSDPQTITLSEHEHKTLDLKIEKPQTQPN